MAKQLQLRRGTTAQHSTFTGAVGEVTIDTSKDVVVVHDGATAGGFPSQKELVSGTNIKTVNSTTLLGSGNIAVQPTLVSGTNIKTINNSTILGSGNLNVISAGMITGGTTNQVLAKNSSTDYDTKWYSVQEPLVSSTNIKTVNSTSLLGSGDVEVQPTLVSGTNIKTVNSTSLLGSGDVAVQPTLVSGTNIKTVNSDSLLGSGNIEINGIGVNQTWQNVTASRSFGVTYTNTTGKPIMVAVTSYNSATAAQNLSLYVNGIVTVNSGSSYGGTAMSICVIIPNNVSYYFVTNGSANKWFELR